MLSAIIIAVVARSPLGSRFDAAVRAAGREKKPIFMIVTEIKNPAWQDAERDVFVREDVRAMLKKVLVLRIPSTDKTRPKVADACGRRSIRTPFLALFDYEGKLITCFSGKVEAGSLNASLTSACAVAARRARRSKTPRVWRKANTTPQAAKLQIAEMYMRNNALDAARTSLETIVREYRGTPEAEKAAAYLDELDAGRKPVIESSAPKASEDAAKDLRMARMLIMNKAAEAAKEKLQSIVTDHPDTSEAEEAQKLLSQME